jgi:hypothetical protein
MFIYFPYKNIYFEFHSTDNFKSRDAEMDLRRDCTTKTQDDILLDQ